MVAEGTDGVTDVDATALKVRTSSSPLSDTAITAKVKAKLLKAKIVDGSAAFWTIHIETNNGVVYVTGTIDSPDQEQKVVDIIKSVNNVKDVKADLTVSSDDNGDESGDNSDDEEVDNTLSNNNTTQTQ